MYIEWQDFGRYAVCMLLEPEGGDNWRVCPYELIITAAPRKKERTEKFLR
jgi:hypothetical protein